MAIRTRIRKAVDQRFGAGTFDSVLERKKILFVNGDVYTSEELKENKNIYISEDDDVEVETEKIPEPAKAVDFMAELEKKLGATKLSDVIAGRAVLAINGNQVIAKDLKDQTLYNRLLDSDKVLVIKAVCGG